MIAPIDTSIRLQTTPRLARRDAESREDEEYHSLLQAGPPAPGEADNLPGRLSGWQIISFLGRAAVIQSPQRPRWKPQSVPRELIIRGPADSSASLSHHSTAAVAMAVKHVVVADQQIEEAPRDAIRGGLWSSFSVPAAMVEVAEREHRRGSEMPEGCAALGGAPSESRLELLGPPMSGAVWCWLVHQGVRGNHS